MDEKEAAADGAHNEDAASTQINPEALDQTLITPNITSDSKENAAELPPADRYQFIRKLGQGGMATVYDAQDTKMDRPVAVKVLRPEFAKDTDMVKRFYEEVRVLAHMDHPGIVAVHDQGDLPGYGPFYAMKRVAGKNLEELMRTYTDLDLMKPGTITVLMDIFKHVCDTMAYSHGKGIIHRDLKPQNIMVDEYGVVLVMDWGIAKRVGGSDGGFSLSRTEVGAIIGTPQYMSPEQASGKVDELDFRSDVFALGVILFELLTGRRPFGGKTSRQVIADVQERTPINPRKLNPNMPRALVAICMKALSKDPDQRYQSALALAQDIQLYEAALPTTAHKPSISERATNGIIRHPVRATWIGILLVLALLTGGIIVSVLQWKEMNRQMRIELAADYSDSSVEQIALIDEELQETRSRLEENNDLAPEAHRRLETRLEELSAVRDMRVRQIDLALITVLPLIFQKTTSEDGEQLLGEWRRMRIREIERLIEVGDLYEAHYNVWIFLHNSQSFPWSAEDLDALLRIKSRVETTLSADGKASALPDWSAYETTLNFAKYLKLSSQ